ncbi:MAG: glycerophosphodiester phosphodiesterase family protein [Hyphomicrobium sp.]|jgi:glycerophosphoryl diester phosphodiesterase
MLSETFLRPIAHRGLHDAGRGIIENTPPAFTAAIDKGYGIECDLRPAKDGLPLVFHDETVERLVHGSGPVADLAQTCAAKLRYKDAPMTGIPTFADLLAQVAGRVPLLVEIKSEWTTPDPRFLREIARHALTYQGPLALMSFDPAVMAPLRDLAPDVPRGIVSGSYKTDGGGWWPGRLADERREALASLLESGPVGPSFYAYHVQSLPTPVTRFAREVLSIPLFAWTVRSAADRDVASTWADAPIFEGYRA